MANLPDKMRARTDDTPLIYLPLVAGFLLLLALIIYIGNFAVAQLDALRVEADEQARDYAMRLQLAIDLRAEIESVIAEARLDRGTRDAMRVRGPSFRSKLNEARQRAKVLLTEGDKLLRNRRATLPEEESKAWDEVGNSAAEFWAVLEQEERRQASPSELGDDALATAPTPEQAAAELVTGEASATPLQKRLDFYESNSRLSKAARNLSTVLINSRDRVLLRWQDNVIRKATDISGRRWWTVGVGLLVALFTGALVLRKVRQNRRSRNEALEAEGLTTSVLNSLRNDVLAFNEQGAVLTANPAFLSHFQFDERECLQQDVRTLLARVPAVRSLVEQAMQQAHLFASEPAGEAAEGHDSSQHARLEIRLTDEPAGLRLFDADVVPRIVSDTPLGHVVLLTDVTEAERNRAEAERNRRLSVVGQLTSQIAHEIYNPLGAVKLNLDLLEMQVAESDEDLRATIARLKRSLEHLNTIVLDLRYVARPREPQRGETELNALLDDVIELASDRLERSRIVIMRDYAAQSLTGNYDPIQLRKVFLNLLINAVEASPRAAEIALRTRLVSSAELPAAMHGEITAARGAYVVSVIDHGTGMSPETRQRVFEAFYSTKQHGTGLGMMITSEIIKKHQGKIEVESEEGVGTTVSVYLPA